MDLEGRAAIVTGAAVGTGRAVALALAARGCHVAVNYSRSRSEAEQTAEEARDLGVRSLPIEANVANDDAVRAMAKQAIDEFGRLDVLVNNAGVTSFIPHADLEAVHEEDWEKILGVNLKGPFYAIRAVVPALRAHHGAIVNVSSIAGVSGTGSSVPYCASKAALNIMTVTLARALAPEIRVNAVAPGFIDTRWWKERDGYDAVKQFAIERTPLGQICQPEDVAAAALSLLSNDLVTGQILVVDGGMSIGR